MNAYRGRSFLLLAMMFAVVFIAFRQQGYAQPEIERDPDFVAGRAALEDEFYATAAANFERYVSKNLSTRLKAYGAIFLFKAWYGQGEYNKIIAWLRNGGWELCDQTRYAGAAVYWYCRAKYATNLYEDTLHHLREFETRYPGDEFLPHVVRLRGAANRELKRMREAAQEFATFDANFPDRPEIPDNLLDWARVLIQLDDEDQARVKLERLVEMFPANTAAHEARLLLGQWSIEKKEFEQAIVMLTALATNDLAARALRAEAWFALANNPVNQASLTNTLRALELGEALSTNETRRVDARIDQARILMSINRIDEAIALMSKVDLVRVSSPMAARVQLELADLLRAQARYDLAVESYQRYIESFSDVTGTRHALLSRAWCLWELQRFGEAATAFEKAYQALGNDRLREQALMKSADAYFQHAQYRLAAEAYDKALQEFPQSSAREQMTYQAGESYARNAQADLAKQRFRALAYAEGVEAGMAISALLRLARVHEAEKAWPEAMTVYEDMLSRFPGSDRSSDALMGLALLKYQDGDYNEARVTFDALFENYPDTDTGQRAFFMRAWCAYQLGETANALEIATEFLRTYPASIWIPEVLFWLAEHEFNTQRYDIAETNFAELAKAHPDSALASQALYWAGRAAMQQKAYLRALENYFNPLVKLYPESPFIPETRFSQGDALSLLNDAGGAIRAFNEMVERFPNHDLAVHALGRIGDCQFDLGAQRPDRYLESIESFRTLLAHPRVTPELAVQAECKLARAFEKVGRPDEAMTHYLNVVYQWMAARGQGVMLDELWFVRAAFSGAALKESAGAWDDAIRIYERVVESGIPAAADAKIRIDRAVNQRQKTLTKPNGA